MKIHEAIRFGAQILSEHGIHDADWNAERCLLLALKTDRADVYSNLDRDLPDQEFEQYRKLVFRRAVHYPLAYLEGVQEFYGRNFYVNEHVLIPRPETEDIIQSVLALNPRGSERIIDLGAGSGCLPVTLAYEISGSKVFAVEIDSGAIEVLKRNAGGKISIVRADLFALPFLGGSFDIATANPPYVEKHELEKLPEETRWEPRLALVTSDLEATYRGVLKSAASVLNTGGVLLFEIGAGQMSRILTVCREFDQFEIVDIRNDRQSIPRVFVLRKN